MKMTLNEWFLLRNFNSSFADLNFALYKTPATCNVCSSLNLSHSKWSGQLCRFALFIAERYPVAIMDLDLRTTTQNCSACIQRPQRDQTMGSLMLLLNARVNASVRPIKRSTAELIHTICTKHCDSVKSLPSIDCLATDCNYTGSVTACL